MGQRCGRHAAYGRCESGARALALTSLSLDVAKRISRKGAKAQRRQSKDPFASLRLCVRFFWARRDNARQPRDQLPAPFQRHIAMRMADDRYIALQVLMMPRDANPMATLQPDGGGVPLYRTIFGGV